MNRSAFLFALSLVVLAVSASAQPAGDAPAVLVVTAHPDDETLVAGALYKLTHTLGGRVDLALVTDGSGGFHYAMIAEPFYGIALHDEEDARENLSPIRKQELHGAGRILGIGNFFFLDALDHEYTTDVDTVLRHVWDATAVRDSLRGIMARGRYDFVFTLLPTEATHGHHKGATILALEAAAGLPAAERPVVLGADFAEAEDLPSPDAPPYSFTGLDGYPLTRVDPAAPVFRFDRTQPMEEDRVVDYKLVVNWALAEHKSQGDLASYYNRGDYEYYWFFDANDPAKLDAAAALFERLGQNPWR